MYLKKMANKKNGIEAKLLDLESRVETDHNGSELMKQICLVRMLADLLDKDGRGIFLLPGEVSVTTSPYLSVIDNQDRYNILGKM